MAGVRSAQGGIRRANLGRMMGLRSPCHAVRALIASAAVAAIVGGCVSSSVRFASAPMRQAAKAEAPRFDAEKMAACTPDPEKLRSVTESYLGTPYKYGGMSRSGVDCSGLAGLVFRELCDVALPRSATDMHDVGREISLERAEPGDLLLFHTGLWSTINHVGIYLGNNKFIHASTSHGVIESSMGDDYYRSHFSQARRLYQ